MSSRAYYSSTVADFLISKPEAIIGEITNHHSQDLVHQQTGAWNSQIAILQKQLNNFENGYICFEVLIPRMGRRADVVLILNEIIFVLEFKSGERQYKAHDLRQTQGYALDLSCFHEASHNRLIIPLLIATEAPDNFIPLSSSEVGVTTTIKANKNNIEKIIESCISVVNKQLSLDPEIWMSSPYRPTPTIIEAAQALYANHDVADIARSDADAVNLTETSNRLNEIIHQARIQKQKTICFVTGVPGAGKTLVGLQIATSHNNSADQECAVFLSGNGPLVEVLREALARDKVKQEENITIGNARRETESFIQNIHHFRDTALNDKNPSVEKVVIFDEAQRAWNKSATTKFMQQKRNQPDFDQSEPEFLIDVMNRHKDWCVIIALIGGGQEINNGEAGLNGWFSALSEKFPDWNIFYSEKLRQKEYAGNDIQLDLLKNNTSYSESCLHLSTSMRSFRAEKLSHLIHYVIHNESESARKLSYEINTNFPLFITRNLSTAKKWINSKVKGMEASGLIASSGAKRLKAEGIFIDDKIKAATWFLNQREDVRSSHFLEDAATEFVVQGLELDWCIVAWDADYRYQNNKFEHWEFKGSKWQRRNQQDQQRYLENSYRVLLSRARQGMVIYIPKGYPKDITRSSEFYNQTAEYLLECGFHTLDE